MEEHKNINLSLSTLGKVVGALSKNKILKHIPFRESKLTRLLKDSLGGKTSTILIGTLSPLGIHTDESISTMKFADRAMKIQVKATANEISPEDDKLVQKLRREVIHLKEILQMRNNKTQKDINLELLSLKEENSRLREMNTATDEMERLRKENKQLRLAIQENQQLMIEAQKPLDNTTDEAGEMDEEKSEEDQEAKTIPDKENADYNVRKESSFFLTEANSEKQERV
mmetsp:Transcript_32151/g.31564  ORF Transcript_32151/g.31564 Transcript_32151/m.31564 type:complete len:228 (+) Transcript_32151:539-1222(+)